ncbi:hypothetical protein V8E55_007343 [Tylopilus felleus]
MPPQNLDTAFLLQRINTLQDQMHGLQNGGCGSKVQVEDHLYKSYKELLRWIPAIRNVPQAELKDAIQQLAQGADSAWANDTHRLKVERSPMCDPPLTMHDKSGQGFYNDTTGRLLCPVDYDWNDKIHWRNICDLHPHFLVTAQSWPSFLYAGGQFDPDDPSKGLFKSEILVKAFKAIFTSPTSAEDSENVSLELTSYGKRRLGERRTRAHVAMRIGMKTVNARAIAYVACQVCFALSSFGSWAIVEGIFDTHKFYDVIVDWFEGAEDEDDRKFIEELLLWWSR